MRGLVRSLSCGRPLDLRCEGNSSTVVGMSNLCLSSVLLRTVEAVAGSRSGSSAVVVGHLVVVAAEMHACQAAEEATRHIRRAAVAVVVVAEKSIRLVLVVQAMHILHQISEVALDRSGSLLAVAPCSGSSLDCFVLRALDLCLDHRFLVVVSLLCV